MKRVLIKNLQNEVTHKQDFATQELAQEWVDTVGPTGAWGMYAHEETDFTTGHPGYYDQQGNLLVPAVPPSVIQVPASFTAEITDVTLEYATLALVTQGATMQQIGASLIAHIYAMNEAAQITAEQFDALLDDPAIAKIERMFWTGALDKAIPKIQALDNTFFTNEQKNQIIAAIEAALAG